MKFISSIKLIFIQVESFQMLFSISILPSKFLASETDENLL